MKSYYCKFHLLMLLLMHQISFAQKNDSINAYYNIPDYPDKYTATTVAARMVDGLGFRFYWATEGLREQDLNFKPGPEARTSLETLRHIYELSVTIARTVHAEIKTSQNRDVDQMSFDEMRGLTLKNLKLASDILKSAGEGNLDDFKIVSRSPAGKTEYPFWNLINGPIADVLWHTGQVVSFRRSSGNPIDPKADVFTGKAGE